jgi:hypothetical protein
MARGMSRELRDSRGSEHGIQTYPSGDKYVGEWRNGLPNGQGNKYRADGPTLRSGILPAMYDDKNFVEPRRRKPPVRWSDWLDAHGVLSALSSHIKFYLIEVRSTCEPFSSISD